MNKEEKILEGVRELAYDLEHSQDDDEFYDIIHNYFTNYHQTCQRDWESIDPQFKPGILVDDFVRQWRNRTNRKTEQLKKDMKEGNRQWAKR